MCCDKDPHVPNRAPCPPGSETAQDLCRAAVRQLMDEFDWRLLPEEEFVALAMETLSRKSSMTPRQAGQNVYSRILYRACRDGSRQERAYTELHYYLYRIACYRRPLHVAEEATQTALLLIFERIHTCRSPDTLLRFTQFKLLQAIKTVDRGHRLDRETPTDDLAWPQPEQVSLTDDQIDDLWDCLHRLWETHPKAHNQLRAVLLKYLDALSDEEIVAQLSKRTPAQVHVLRSLGLKKLRQCMAGKGYGVKRGVSTAEVQEMEQ